MISSILQYSTIDFRFLKTNLDQLSKISDEIIIPICDHFFNGEPENQKLLDQSIEIIKSFPNTQFGIFEWEGIKNNTAYYHNLSRYLGTKVAANDLLFFVDSDEIVDSEKFNKWIKTNYNNNHIYWLTCYWYFREPIYQSKSYEGCGLLINKNQCHWNIDIREERQQFHHGSNFVHGGYNHILIDNEPIMHHFSWVRTKEEMIKKTQNWGHKNDMGWLQLIEDEFSREFNGSDFIHHYDYNIVNNKYGL
jgi:hypothetical protein